ncbi:MAG: hypothetical protein J6O51_04510 [Bacteroidales bacterium]|nr:hypothetical protein [Bacteroidales bacterium]
MKKIQMTILASAALFASMSLGAQQTPSLGLPSNASSAQPEMAAAKVSYYARNYTVSRDDKGGLVLTNAAEVRYDAKTGREYIKFADGSVQLAVTKTDGKEIETTVYRVFDDNKTYTKNVFKRKDKEGKVKYEVYMGRWSQISAFKTITRYVDCETGIPFATLSKDVLVQMTAGIERGEQPAEFFVLPEDKGYKLVEDGMSKLYDMVGKTK